MRIKSRIILQAIVALIRRLLVSPELPGARVQQLLQITRRRPHPSSFNVFEVPQHHVRQGGRQTHIGGDEVGDVSSCEPGDAFLRELGVVDFELVVEDEGLVVDNVAGAVGGGVEEFLGEEGEVVGPPDVAVVDAHEQNVAPNDTDHLVDQRLQRIPKRTPQTSNIIPIKAN